MGFKILSMELTCYIVDDEQHCIYLTSDLIATTDFLKIIGTANDSRMAIAEIRALKPDVVFTDINMPYLSGVDLANQVKDVALVVFVTAEMPYFYPEINLEKSLFLTKPVSLSRFLIAASEIKSRLGKN